MSRSLKKGPFIDPKLESKVVAQAEGNKILYKESDIARILQNNLIAPSK